MPSLTGGKNTIGIKERMYMQVLIISGSPRRQGNSDLLCDEFARGAREKGHSVEKINLQEKDKESRY